MLSAVASQSERLAAACLDSLLRGDDAWREALYPLVDLALGPEPEAARQASTALFRDAVEPLADRFDPALGPRYRELMTAVIDRCRRHPDLKDLPPPPDPAPVDISDVREVVVPSRVTLGADVAVTSVILRACLERFPEADVCFLGGGKSAELFEGEHRLRSIVAPYPRGGTLLDRLAVWPAACAALPPGALVVDPDSRITQLGMLPLAPPSRTVHFDSRAYGGESAEPLGRLAGAWAVEALGLQGPPPSPWVNIRRAAPGAEKVAAVNFGVGGNPAKRVPGDFELKAVQMLVERGYRVILDRGFGEEEARWTQAILDAAPGVQPHEGSLRSFGEVIAAAHLFLGYDSAAGHLAAAIGTPGVTVFAGAVTERMRHRWSPYGPGPSEVVPVGSGDDPVEILERLRQALP